VPFINLGVQKHRIRFKYPGEIPYALIKDLAGKMTLEQWLEIYEGSLQERNTTKGR